jgi:hypothetical protein
VGSKSLLKGMKSESMRGARQSWNISERSSGLTAKVNRNISAPNNKHFAAENPLLSLLIVTSIARNNITEAS